MSGSVRSPTSVQGVQVGQGGQVLLHTITYSGRFISPNFNFLQHTITYGPVSIHDIYNVHLFR